MTELEVFENLVSRRKTIKVMSDVDLPPWDESVPIGRLLTSAGWAPFHRPCSADHQTDSQLSGIEPWRFHVVDSSNCRKLRDVVSNLEGAGKIPEMLASAKALVLATWLPTPPKQPPPTENPEYFEPTIENAEHIAATSAAIQSFLLAATAAEMESYWSSGGVLRSASLFNLLGIPLNQRLLGAVFLFPSRGEIAADVQVVESKLRLSRGSPDSWSRRVEWTL